MTTPLEITTQLTRVGRIVQLRKRIVPPSLTRRLRESLSADANVWNGEVEAAVIAFETQCRSDPSVLSHQLRKARGGQRHATRIAEEEEMEMERLASDLVATEARDV